MDPRAMSVFRELETGSAVVAAAEPAALRR